MEQAFETAVGSIVGTDHLGDPQILLGKNNQDASVVCSGPLATVGIVCDGCGSSLHSELGAQLAAELLAKRIFVHVQAADIANRPMTWEWATTSLEEVRSYLLGHIDVLSKAMLKGRSRSVNDYFLFTVMGVVITESVTWIFSCGDGLFHLNGETVELQPEAGNQPIYLSYGLTGSALTDEDPSLLKFKMQRFLDTKDVQRIIIATDGASQFEEIRERTVPGKTEVVGGIEQFFADRYFKNPDTLRRRLAMLNTRKFRLNAESNGLDIERGLLKDDTTIIAIRRKP